MNSNKIMSSTLVTFSNDHIAGNSNDDDDDDGGSKARMGGDKRHNQQQPLRYDIFSNDAKDLSLVPSTTPTQ